MKVKEAKTPAAPEAETIDPAKTVVDDTGLLDQLGNLKALDVLTKDLADKIKALCMKHGAKRMQSGLFDGVIFGGGTSARGKVNTRKFLALCKKRGVKPAQIEAATEIVRDRVTFLSEEELDTCCEPGSMQPWKLSVFPRRDRPAPTLTSAIEGLAADSKAGKIAPPAEKPARGTKRDAA